MNRNILFRGKDFHNNIDWYKGYYVQTTVSYLIYDNEAIGHMVVGDTVGQYSYATDTNDNYIFEDDIVKVTLKIAKHEIIGIVYFDLEDNSFRLRFDDGSTIFLDSGKHDNFEVIGNIYDNEDLVKDFLPIDKELS